MAEKEKAEKALLKLYDRRGMQEDNGVSENSQAWKRLTIQIQNAEEEVQRYEAALAAMETNGTAFVQGNQTPEYGETLSQLADMAQQMENYQGFFRTICERICTSCCQYAGIPDIKRDITQRSRADTGISRIWPCFFT